MLWQCDNIQGLWTKVKAWIDSTLGIHLPHEPCALLLYYDLDIPVDYYPVVVLILTLVKILIYDNKDNCTLIKFIQVKRYIIMQY